jgi:hypothetical protein
VATDEASVVEVDERSTKMRYDLDIELSEQLTWGIGGRNHESGQEVIRGSGKATRLEDPVAAPLVGQA